MTRGCHSYYDCDLRRLPLRPASTDASIATFIHGVEHQLLVNDLGDDDLSYRLLVIGPDRSSNLLEIIVLIFDDEWRMAVHAMPIRPTYLSLFPQPGATDA